MIGWQLAWSVAGARACKIRTGLSTTTTRRAAGVEYLNMWSARRCCWSHPVECGHVVDGRIHSSGGAAHTVRVYRLSPARMWDSSSGRGDGTPRHQFTLLQSPPIIFRLFTIWHWKSFSFLTWHVSYLHRVEFLFLIRHPLGQKRFVLTHKN
jgi:hypothetical protein